MNKYASFIFFRRVVLLMRLCPMPNGPFRALLDGGGNLLDGGGLVVRWCPGGLLLSTVPKLRNLLTHFCTNLLPGANVGCRCFKLKFDRNHRLVSCSDVVKMYVSTQNVFSLMLHIVLHQVHWHLFCHLLHYICAKNRKFGMCCLSERDDNLGVLLSGPPCISLFDEK